MSYRTIEKGSVAVVVAHGGIFYADYARIHNDGVRHGIVCVGLVYFQTEAIGKQPAFHVDEFKRAVEFGMACCLAFYIR